MDEIVRPVPAGWIEALEASDAELEAGLTVSSGPVRQRLRDSIVQMEARLALEKRVKPKSGD